jgi:hypothetical protein
VLELGDPRVVGVVLAEGAVELTAGAGAGVDVESSGLISQIATTVKTTTPAAAATALTISPVARGALYGVRLAGLVPLIA